MYHGIKEKVIELRVAGKMYSEIQAILNIKIPKSTLWTWCKGVTISDAAKLKMSEKIEQTLAISRIKAMDVLKQKRLSRLDKIYDLNKKLAGKIKNNSIAKIALSMLYLGEGGKTRSSVMFGSSDPNIIGLFLSLLRQCYTLDESKLRFTLQCRADQNVTKLESYWSKVTKIPLSQCYKVQIDPRTKGKPSKKPDYKGVCRIDYFSGHIDDELKIIVKLINKIYQFDFGPVV
jgi:hypothetical protein